MDLPELHKQFEELSEQVKDATKSQPVIAVLVNALLSLFQMLFTVFNEKIDELNKTIQTLQEKLGNKVVDSKRANNENINGRGSEK